VRSRFVGLAGCTKTSFIDFPGAVSTVLFFGGCNLRCPYCHNPHVVEYPGALDSASEEVWRLLETRRHLVDGVVLSGGEPTLNPHIETLTREIASLGYRIKLDTNGLMPDMIERLAPDYLALDVKTAPDRYAPLLGAPYADTATRIGRSVAIARTMGERAEVRITVAPGIVDHEAVMVLKSLLRGIKTVYLQSMRARTRLMDPSYQLIDPVPTEEIRRFRDLLGETVDKCLIRDDFGDPADETNGVREARAA
jgi:pyruvate formate lyase activating enzyme